MRQHRSREAKRTTVEDSVLAALSELDCAKAPSQRKAVLHRLHSLTVGGGELNKVLRKCLA